MCVRACVCACVHSRGGAHGIGRDPSHWAHVALPRSERAGVFLACLAGMHATVGRKLQEAAGACAAAAAAARARHRYRPDHLQRLLLLILVDLFALGRHGRPRCLRPTKRGRHHRFRATNKILCRAFFFCSQSILGSSRSRLLRGAHAALCAAGNSGMGKYDEVGSLVSGAAAGRRAPDARALGLTLRYDAPPGRARRARRCDAGRAGDGRRVFAGRRRRSE